MSKEKTVNVEISVTELKELLLRHLDIKDATNVANLIIGHVAQTDKGISQLFKALLGIFPTLIYKEKDFVYVDLSSLPSWRMDKIKTSELPTVKDGFILAQITDCNVYSGNPYRVNYETIRDGQTKPEIDVAQVTEASIKEKVEDFVDILDLLENFKSNNTE